MGIVLSGTGSDGTEGLAAIKAENGITFARSPQSAKFEGMPQSAISAGVVDLILDPPKIATELGRLAQHPHIAPAAITKEPQSENRDSTVRSEDSLGQIFLLLRQHCNVDFTHYKHTTLMRRINRRMMLHRIENLKAYALFLSRSEAEIKALYADILIHVTGFFRDPEAFEALKKIVFPKILENRTPGNPIRIWVPGCSTGEEVYSIAIELLEFLGERASQIQIQIFASDISDHAIQKARNGEYLESINRLVSPERLNRFFEKSEGGGYKVSKSVRNLCLFSRHDVTSDPPFAKIDLISCRNLLIYFSVTLQKHVIPIFHYALNSNGILWLGKTESITGFSNLFTILDPERKIYIRKPGPTTLSLNFPNSIYRPGPETLSREATQFVKVATDVKSLADQIIQAEYPGVLINDDMEVVQFLGQTGAFINPSPGTPSHNLFKIARPEILSSLLTAIQMVKKNMKIVKRTGLAFKDGSKFKIFNLKVIPNKPSATSKNRYFLVLFEDLSDSITPKNKASRELLKQKKLKNPKQPQVLQLERELIAAQDYQHSLIEKYEATQEDLTTANEELQSANEELETAKEELQSGNEELTSVNDELQIRSREQIQSNNDLLNLLGSVQIPIVMLGIDRKVRRFTPLAEQTFNLIPADIGRPLGDLKLNLNTPGKDLDLDHLISEVIKTMTPTEIEVQDLNGRWYRLQSKPYRTLDGKIDGAVLALVDINDLKMSLKEIKTSRSEAEKANRAKDLFLATLSHELRTPLTAILSWAQLLQSGKLNPEKIKRAGEMIEDCGNAQAELINDLLDVSRIITGKISLEMSEIDPVDTIIKTIESIRPTAEKKSIEIQTFYHPEHVGTVMADPTRLKQIFLNLLTNAIKFSHPNSKVTITLGRSKDTAGEKARILIKVTDYGKGIHPGFMPYIFERFSQEDSSSMRLHGGLGLGLALVRNLVELHGGTVVAESAGENLGASFTITLPLKSEYSSAKAQRVNSDPLGPSRESTVGKKTQLDGIRVLLIDDQPSSREAFTESLRSLGAETQAAESAEEGFKIFKEFKPDVLVSDIAMPGEDGYSLMQRIRELPADQQGTLPAIALTAYASQDDIKAALSAGFQAHLAKPVVGYHLAELIAKLAGQKASRTPHSG